MELNELATQRFALSVKEIRAKRDLRQFAQIVGVSHATIRAWESGEIVPRKDKLEKIASLRGETLDQFLSFLHGEEPEVEPMTRLLNQLQGATKPQLAQVLRAIANRLDSLGD